MVIAIDPAYYRPSEVPVLLGDYSKAKRELGRQPTYTFEKMIQEMVAHDREQALAELHHSSMFGEFKQLHELKLPTPTPA